MKELWFKIKQFCYWGWKLRNTVDYDGSTLYDVIYLKLDSIYNCFINDGHLVWNSDKDNKNMRKLRVAIELAKRLSERDCTFYCQDLHDKHDLKWGKIKFNFEKIDNKLSYMITSRCNVITEKDKIQESKELRLIYKKEQSIRKHNKELLFKLLFKYLDSWWD